MMRKEKWKSPFVPGPTFGSWTLNLNASLDSRTFHVTFCVFCRGRPSSAYFVLGFKRFVADLDKLSIDSTNMDAMDLDLIGFWDI